LETVAADVIVVVAEVRLNEKELLTAAEEATTPSMSDTEF
jgi:hypothetical protein